MGENNKYKKIVEKVVELFHLSDRDEMLYGDSYLEIKEGEIRLINPKNIIHHTRTCESEFCGKGLIEPEPGKLVNFNDFKDALDDFVNLIEIEKKSNYGIDDLIAKAKRLKEAHLEETKNGYYLGVDFARWESNGAEKKYGKK